MNIMDETKTVYLLYECDQWLSQDSFVLMGVFSTRDNLRYNAEKLIVQRIDEHVKYAKEQSMDYDFSDEEKVREDVLDDLLTELFTRRVTMGWETNYCYEEVELDKLNEI